MEAHVEKARTESARERAEAEKEWQIERGQLYLKISRLEKSGGTDSAASGIDPRAAIDLEKKRQELASSLQAAEKAHHELEHQLGTERGAWESERESLTSTLSNLEASLSAAASKVDASELDTLRKELESRIRTATEALAEAERRSEAASTEWETEKQELAKDIEDLRNRLDQSSSTREEDRESLTAKIRQLEESLAQTASHVAPSEIEALRKELTSKLEQTQSTHSELEQRHQTELGQWETERKALAEEVSTLRASVAEGASKIDATQLDTLRAELEARIQTATQEQADIQQRLETSSAEWKTEKQDLSRTIVDLEQNLAEQSSKVDQTELDTIKDELLSKLAESEERRAALDGKLETAAEQWEKDRSGLQALLDASKQNIEAADEVKEAELREKLSLEYDWKIQELTFQKDQLEQEMSSAGPAVTPSLNGTEKGTDISEEIATMDSKILELTAFIENPSSALSSVIRKNVERAELEAYRRGLSFWTGAAADKNK
jgi:chromosome segregation ATPase